MVTSSLDPLATARSTHCGPLFLEKPIAAENDGIFEASAQQVAHSLGTANANAALLGPAQATILVGHATCSRIAPCNSCASRALLKWRAGQPAIP